MSNCVLYAANKQSQSFVAAGTVVNFGQPVHGYGNAIVLSGGNAVLNCQGYFAVIANVSFTATTGGTITIQLYKDGVAIPGAQATVIAVANGGYAVAVPAILRQKCCCESVITAEISGATGTVTNAAIVVGKT